METGIVVKNKLDEDAIRLRLCVVAEEYRIALEERNGLRESVNFLDNTMKMRRMNVLDEVSRETDADGKKRFSNDTMREAETQRRMERDADVIESMTKFINATRQLSMSETHIAVLEMEVKNLRCVLDSLPQDLNIRARG